MEMHISTISYSLRQAEEWLVGRSPKSNSDYASPLILYAVILFVASIIFWHNFLQNQGDITWEPLCVPMSVVGAPIMYLLAGHAILKSKYERACSFSFLAIIFNAGPIINQIFKLNLLLFFLFDVMPVLLLIYSIWLTRKKEEDNKDDIKNSYFPPPPATP